MLSGNSNLGNTLVLGVDNPLGTQPSGSTAWLAISGPSPAFPCGSLLPGFGATGGVAELLIAPMVGMPLFAGTSPWTGPGSPVSFSFSIPNNPTLLGLTAYVQGLLVAPPMSSVPYALTSGLEARVIP